MTALLAKVKEAKFSWSGKEEAKQSMNRPILPKGSRASESYLNKPLECLTCRNAPDNNPQLVIIPACDVSGASQASTTKAVWSQFEAVMYGS